MHILLHGLILCPLAYLYHSYSYYGRSKKKKKKDAAFAIPYLRPSFQLQYYGSMRMLERMQESRKDHPHSFSFVWGPRFGPTYPSIFGFSLALEGRGHWTLDSADLGGRKSGFASAGHVLRSNRCCCSFCRKEALRIPKFCSLRY